MGTPLELIKYDPATRKFKVGDQAADALRKVTGPVGVVSVCGRARQGKSYILNQLLGRSGGFEVASTHRPCTKGLWLWSEPVPMTGPDGRKYHLVLLDSEGISAYDQTGQYSTQIFSLAVLLSSLFVYNQMGGIDEAALDQLSLVTEMTKKIRSVAEGGGSLGEFFPSFLWLLRDFYLDLVEDGRKIDAKEYLEITLRSAVGSRADVQAQNQIRESIKSLFPDRDCAMLVRPVNDEAQLKMLSKLDPKKLRPEFTKGVEELTRRIFRKAQPKRIGNHVVSGAALAGLAEAYVHAINEGAVPAISTAWQSVAESECLRAADAAEAHYHATFSQKVSSDEKEMDKEHERALSQALKVFHKAAIGDDSIQERFANRLEEAVTARYKQFREKRIAEAAAEVESLLSRADADLQKAIRAGVTPVSLHHQMKSFVDEYKDFASGPTKWRSLCKFLWDVYGTALIEWLEGTRKDEKKLKDAVASAQKELEEVKGKETTMSLEVQNARHELVVATEKISTEKARRETLGKELASFKRDFVNLQRQLSEASSEGKGLREVKVKAESALQEARHEADVYKKKEQALLLESDALRKEFAERIRRLEEDKENLAKENASFREKVEAEAMNARKATEGLDELKAERNDLHSEVMKLRRSCKEGEGRCNSLMSEGAKLNADKQEKELELLRANDEIRRLKATQEDNRHQTNVEISKLRSELEEAHFNTIQVRSVESELRLSLQHEKERRERVESSNQRQIEELKRGISSFEQEAEQAYRSSVGGKRRRASEKSHSGTQGNAENEDGQITPESVQSMTITEIKRWLTEKGCEGVVWDLASNRHTKKAHWVKAAKERMEEIAKKN
ncbi:hypothetical protein BSKO_01143 [Bryopsis sp. KO-2023]|nr:hypothetical protein BSKO_01143 [Bryopsis sp. KO-2023]